MKCYYHGDRDAVAQCNVCGKGLCKECADVYEPPVCQGCGTAIEVDVKAEAKKTIIRSIVLFILGAVLMLGVVISAVSSVGSMGASFAEVVETLGSLIFLVLGSGWVVAGIPCGWKRLNKLTSSLFLFLPIIGWVIYFCVKIMIAYIIGIVLLPVDIVKSIKILKTQ